MLKTLIRSCLSSPPELVWLKPLQLSNEGPSILSSSFQTEKESSHEKRIEECHQVLERLRYSPVCWVSGRCKGSGPRCSWWSLLTEDVQLGVDSVWSWNEGAGWLNVAVCSCFMVTWHKESSRCSARGKNTLRDELFSCTKSGICRRRRSLAFVTTLNMLTPCRPAEESAQRLSCLSPGILMHPQHFSAFSNGSIKPKCKLKVSCDCVKML